MVLFIKTRMVLQGTEIWQLQMWLPSNCAAIFLRLFPSGNFSDKRLFMFCSFLMLILLKNVLLDNFNMSFLDSDGCQPMKNFFALFSLYLKRFCKKCYGRSGFTETYSEPSQMEVFAVKIVNSLSAIFAKVSTLDV